MKKTISIIPTTLLTIALLAQVVSGRLHAPDPAIDNHNHSRMLSDEFTVLTTHYSPTGRARHFGSYTTDGVTTWNPTDLGRPVDESNTPRDPWAVAYDFCVEKVFVILVTRTYNSKGYTCILAVMTPSASNTELTTIGVMKTNGNSLDNMKALAVNPITNELFGYDGHRQLYKINKKTAALEPIGFPQTDVSTPLGMSFDSSGRLYLMCSPAYSKRVQVYKVDSVNGSISLHLEVDTPYTTKNGSLFHHWSWSTNTDTEDLLFTSGERLYLLEPATGSASLASNGDEEILIGMRGGDVPKPYPPRDSLMHTFDDFTMLTTHYGPTGFRHFGTYTTDGNTIWDRKDLGRPVDEAGYQVDPWAVAYDNGGEKVYVILVKAYTSYLAFTTATTMTSDVDTIGLGKIGVMKKDDNEHDYMKALAVNPITNELYGYDGRVQLYKINKKTAVIEPIGLPQPKMDCSYPLDMSFDSWGQLYLMCSQAPLNGVQVYKVDSIKGTISLFLNVDTPYQTNYGSLLHHWADTGDLLFTSGDRLHQVWPAMGFAHPACPETQILIGMRGGDAPNPRTCPILLTVDQLYADVEEYIATAGTFQNPQKVIDAIYEKVEMAFKKAVDSGKPNAAAGILDGVIAKIKGYVADGLLTKKAGDQIIKDLEELRDLLKKV